MNEPCANSRSERQAALAGGVGQRSDAAVIHVAAAVEDDFLDAGRQRALGEQLADLGRRRLVGAGLDLALDVLVERRGRRERRTLTVIDGLGIDVLARAEDAEARADAGGLAQRVARAPLAAGEKGVAVGHVLSPLLLLAFLATDLLGRILDALALVGLGRTQAADLRRELSDLLTIRAGDLDLGRLQRLDLDAGRDRNLDVVAVAELQLQHLGIRLGAVADAVDLEVDGEAVRHAAHHVAREVARRAPLHAGAAAVGARREDELVAVAGDRDVVVHHELQLAPLALGLEMLALELDGDSGGDRNRVFADARHGQNTLQMTSPPTLAARASASDMTPRGVDRIEMPSPLKWRGSSRIFE